MYAGWLHDFIRSETESSSLSLSLSVRIFSVPFQPPFQSTDSCPCWLLDWVSQHTCCSVHYTSLYPSFQCFQAFTISPRFEIAGGQLPEGAGVDGQQVPQLFERHRRVFQGSQAAKNSPYHWMFSWTAVKLHVSAWLQKYVSQSQVYKDARSNRETAQK